MGVEMFLEQVHVLDEQMVKAENSRSLKLQYGMRRDQRQKLAEDDDRNVQSVITDISDTITASYPSVYKKASGLTRVNFYTPYVSL